MKRYFLFLVLNAALVCSAIYLFMPGKRTGPEELLWIAFVPAILIIMLQYRFLIRYPSWLLKIFVFYLSMVLFLILFGAILSWNTKVSGYEAGTAMARILGSVEMIYLGHIFGGLCFPIVVFSNWLFRKQLFPVP